MSLFRQQAPVITEARVKERVAEILGDRVSLVQTVIRDHGYFLGVGVIAPSGHRTAVGDAVAIIEADTNAWIDATCAKFGAWLDTI